jgi:regulatory protein
VRLLARREHSVAQLRRKLVSRGFAADLVEPVLADLSARGLLSDARFAEAYVRERTDKGFGPLRIRTELRERGVAQALAEHHLSLGEESWMAVLAAAHRRKYGESPPADHRELARRARFLEYRGFTSSQVNRFLEYDD